VAIRHWRDAATALNVFIFFVAMDEEDWSYDAHGAGCAPKHWHQ
jgi:hypothetical protein